MYTPIKASIANKDACAACKYPTKNPRKYRGNVNQKNSPVLILIPRQETLRLVKLYRFSSFLSTSFFISTFLHPLASFRKNRKKVGFLMSYQDFENLPVYKKARAKGFSAYELVKKLPSFEEYNLRKQVSG